MTKTFIAKHIHLLYEWKHFFQNEGDMGMARNTAVYRKGKKQGFITQQRHTKLHNTSFLYALVNYKNVVDSLS